MSNEKKPKLSPFEQNEENIKKFRENMKLYESVVLLVDAAIKLDLAFDTEESDQLEEMLKTTILQFSKFLEDRGDKWN